MAGEEEISDAEKVRISSDFILHSPPGEFNEVFNDVRVLMANDSLLKEGASSAFSQYNKDQLTPVHMEAGGSGGNDSSSSSSSSLPCLVTDYNDLGHGRFGDPRSRQSFKYDHLRKEASDFAPWSPDSSLEPLRSAIETEATAYALNHYKHGVCSTFSVPSLMASEEEGGGPPSRAVVVCIEDHQFQPRNYWNGRWRSVWIVRLSGGGNQAEVSGLLKVQVHYYEDGNVQLVSSKDVKEAISVSSDESAAKELTKLMEESESVYQTAISENYTTMSDTTFKALRRPLPVTRTKIDWNKIVSYSIGKELKSQ